MNLTIKYYTTSTVSVNPLVSLDNETKRHVE